MLSLQYLRCWRVSGPGILELFKTKLFVGGKGLIGAFVFGVALLAIRFLFLADHSLGRPLGLEMVSQMPELTVGGRWVVWPVENISSALINFSQQGIFVFRALWKSLLPDVWKDILLAEHALFLFIFGPASLWWLRTGKGALRSFFLLK